MKAQRAGKLSRGRLFNNLMRNSWQNPGRTETNEQYHQSFASVDYDRNYDSRISSDEITEAHTFHTNEDHLNPNHEDLMLDVDYLQIDPDDFILNDDIRSTDLPLWNDLLRIPSAVESTLSPSNVVSSITETDTLVTHSDRQTSTETFSIETFLTEVSTTEQSTSYQWMVSHWTTVSTNTKNYLK